MGRAWFSGFSAVFLAHLAWFGVVAAAAHVAGLMPLIVILLPVFLNVAGLAAFLIARRSPRHPLLALTMAPLTAVLGTASNLLFPFAGARVDITGFYNDAGLFTSLLLYGAFVSVLGAFIGIWTNRKSNAEIPATVSTAPATSAALPEISVAPAPTAAELPQIRSD